MTILLESQPKQSHLTAAILGIGTANPPHITQSESAQLAKEFSCSTDTQRAWLNRVFLRSGINHRACTLANPLHPDSSAAPMDNIRSFYPPQSSPTDRGPTTATRMVRYAQEAPPLLAQAAQRTLDNARIPAAEITHLITVSCTGFFAPGLDIALIHRLHLRPDIHRQHLGFMGCHAAFNALAAASDIVRANPNALVLVASVELSTLHFAYGFHPEKLVANALFADGASAAICGARLSPAHAKIEMPNAEHEPPAALSHSAFRIPHSAFLLASASLLLPNSAAAMTWHIGDHGFEMTLSAELPNLIAQHIRPWTENFLAQNNLTIPDIQHWALHPGGPKIFSAAAQALNLPTTALEPSLTTLAHHGNMSSATLLFLLQHISQNSPQGPCLAIGFGPGLMAEALLLDFAAPA